MKAANIDICKELFELSGWAATIRPYGIGDGLRKWFIFADNSNIDNPYLVEGWDYSANEEFHSATHIPAYGCGYLLRKLSSFDYKVKGKQGDIMPVRCRTFIWQETEHQWRAGYKYNLNGQRYADLFIYADTPENALCKLAIELFKQGILTKE